MSSAAKATKHSAFEQIERLLSQLREFKADEGQRQLLVDAGDAARGMLASSDFTVSNLVCLKQEIVDSWESVTKYGCQYEGWLAKQIPKK